MIFMQRRNKARRERKRLRVTVHSDERAGRNQEAILEDSQQHHG